MKQSQGFGTVAIIGVLAVVVLVGGVLFINKQNTNKAAMEAQAMAEKAKMEEAAMMEKKAMEEKAMMEKETMQTETGAMKEQEDIMKGDDSMMKKEEATEGDTMMKKDDSAMMQKSGTYTTYSSESLAMAQKGKTVLFFHASWCPTCRTADADITKNGATIPAGATILKVDYDSEVALKQKYGVTSQHTFVEIDAKGTVVEKWTGGNLAGIVAKL